MLVFVLWLPSTTCIERDISGSTATSTVPRSSSACASAILSALRSDAEAIAPGPRCWPGTIVSMVVPSEAIRSFTDCWAPRPSATIAITADTPITMPSMVRNERSLFARSASIATVKVSKSGISAPSLPAAAATASPAATSAADAAGHAADALPHVLLLLRARGLRLSDAQHHDLLALAHSCDHLRPIEVAEPEADEAGLDPLRRLHEDHLCAARAPRPCRAAAATGAATTRSTGAPALPARTAAPRHP